MDISDLLNTPDLSLKTEFHKLQERMQNGLKPLQNMEYLLKLAAPTHQLQELLRQLEPNRHIHEMFQRSAVPPMFQDLFAASSIAVQAKSMLDQHLPLNALASLKAYDDVFSIAAAPNSFTELSKQYEGYLKPLLSQQNHFDQMNRRLHGGFTGNEFALQLHQQNSTFKAMEDARSSLNRLWNHFADIDFSRFEADITEEQEAYSAIEQINVAATSEPTLQEALHQILAAIDAQQHPAVKVLLWFYFKKFLETLFGGAVGAVLGFYFTSAMTPSASPQEEKKVVKTIARQVVGAPEFLTEYRYVSAKVLIVRQNARSRSPEIARLTFGKPVQLIKKEKDFALVAWNDRESGAEVQGWVFARYLNKFN